MKYVLAILALGVLILVHELGHFIMAKVNGVKVNTFSIGMGPKIFTYHGKETEYSLSLLPIGGYVEMLGTGEAVDDEKSFSNKSPLRRISIVIAGIVMNFILAIGLFTAVLSHYGFAETTIDKLTPNGALLEAGVKEGSEIKEINGSKIITYFDIQLCSDIAEGKELDIVYKYKGETKNVTITPKYSKKDKRYLMGASFSYDKNPSVLKSTSQSFKEIGSLVKMIGKTLGNLITGKGNFKTDIGGPVAVVQVSAQAAESGIWSLMYLVAYMSISLAVFNLIPIPALDGGWAVLLLIELITRRKVPEKVVGVLNTIFFILLMVLMFAVTVKDILFPVA